MKIGILSMQRIKNSGSFLQGYALKHEIEALGHSVVWVDFSIKYKENSNKEKKKFALLRKVLGPCKRKAVGVFRLMTSSEYRRKRNALKFVAEFGSFFDKQLYADLGMTAEYQYHPEMDMLVIGSDEVFNLIQFENEYHAEIPWELYGYGFENIKVISYAASCGTTTTENMKRHGFYEKSTECLSKLSDISVRDKNTKEYIESMGMKCHLNIDPVLLYDFGDYTLPQINLKDYIVVYGYSFRFTDEEKKAIRKFADSKGKKLICVNEQQDFCDENLVVHPLEMLSYFKNADYVITDTFHGAVISLKYHKTFGAFIRESNKQKLGYLLEHFEMTSRSVKNADALDKIMNSPVDYRRFDEILTSEQEKARNYLKSAIGN